MDGNGDFQVDKRSENELCQPQRARRSRPSSAYSSRCAPPERNSLFRHAWISFFTPALASPVRPPPFPSHLGARFASGATRPSSAARRQSAMTPTSLQATKKHQDMATYSATTLQSFVPELVETLMVEQPADPVRFLRTHLDTLVGEPIAAAAAAEADTEAESAAATPSDDAAGTPRTTELRRLRAEVAKLRSENEQLLQAQDAVVGGAAGAGAGVLEEATLSACNWNLAGVNENPFEFAASRDERFPRIAAFIQAVDTILAQVLFTPDQEDEDSEETQISAAVTEPFAGQVREMQLTELLQGLLAVADSVKASADDDGEEEEEVDVVSQIRKKKASGIRRSFSVAPQQWKDVDTDGDGVVDAVAYDVNGDGVYNGLDLDGDGKIDVYTEQVVAEDVGPLTACKLGAAERSLAMGLGEIVAGEPPRLLDLLHRGLSSGYFSSPDLKLKDRAWTLTNSRPESVKKFLAACCSCFAEVGQVELEVDEEIWWQHWLTSVCDAYPAEKHDALPQLAFPLAAFDVLLTKIAGRVIAKMEPEEEAEAFLSEMKQYVEAMRTTSEAKARALAKAFEWLILSYSPSVVALQEFNAGWLAEPHFRRFWTDYVDGVHTEGGGFEVVGPPVIKNKMQQTMLLLKKGEHSGLQLDREQTRKLADCIEDQQQLVERLRAAFSAIFPAGIVEMQVENALNSLKYKCAAAVCTLCKEDGVSLGNPKATESVLVVAAHAASNGTDNRAIVAAVKELALWLGMLPGARSTPRMMVMMDANSAATFPKKGVNKGAACQQVFSCFLQSDAELTSCWLENMSSRRQLLEPRSERASVFSFRFSWQNRLTKTGPGPQ